MTEFISELVSYHVVSPDPVIPGCRNTGYEEDGVVFNFEPLEGMYSFVGRTSMIEGVAMLFGLTPQDVLEALGEPLEEFATE